MKNEVKTTSTAKMWIEDGILHCQLLPGADIKIDQAKEIVEETLKICNGRNIPILGDLSRAKFISRESREYLSDHEAMKAAASLAVLTDSQVSKVIGNFLIGLNKPTYPIKLFTSEKEAMDWLKDFVK